MIDFKTLYAEINQELPQDADLTKHFHEVKYRVEQLTANNINTLQDWQNTFTQQADDEASRLGLLSLAKSKPYWHQITTHDDFSHDAEDFREQLALAIGRFYSDHLEIPTNHLGHWLQHLRQ